VIALDDESVNPARLAASVDRSQRYLIYLIKSGLMARMTATEVSRNFSRALNRVFAGEEIEIVRNGAVVARLTPPERARLLSAERFRELIASLPPVDHDFVRDLEDIRREVGPPASAWPS